MEEGAKARFLTMAEKPKGLSPAARVVGAIIAITIFADLIWGAWVRSHIPPLAWYGLWVVVGLAGLWFGTQIDAVNRKIRSRRNA